MRERLGRIIAERTGQPLERVMKDIDRDYWMSIDEAKDYGILGTVANSMADIKF
jgi:ATP-dependent Clp protease, protease subunit